ncbi:MAG: 2-phospho-L-lactate transferase [Pseudomonadota bacterium]
MNTPVKVTLLAGGVGGARMAEGFQSLADVALTVIGNVADDEAFHGLWVSPDIDTMTYTLAGVIDRAQGWGVADEGDRALSTLNRLGADTWMFLGDRDFGLHIYRTKRLRRGDRPSEIARDVAARFGVRAEIVLPTDDRVQTRLETAAGWLSFQEYFVRERCGPRVSALSYEGIAAAAPTPEALTAIAEADLLVIAPSNPLLSIAPILGIPGIGPALQAARAPILGVSPLIGGKAVKGPADRLMTSLGHRPDALGVAEIYRDLLDMFFIDTADAALQDGIADLGITPLVADILIPDAPAKARLAREILDAAVAEPALETGAGPTR